MQNSGAQVDVPVAANVVDSQSRKPQPPVLQRQVHAQQLCSADSMVNTVVDATEQTCMNSAAIQCSSKSLLRPQQVNRNSGNAPIVQNNQMSAPRASINPAPSWQIPNLRTAAASRDLGAAALLMEPNDGGRNSRIIHRIDGKSLQEQALIGPAPLPYKEGPPIMARQSAALNESPRTALELKSPMGSPSPDMMPDRARRLPNKDLVPHFHPQIQKTSSVALPRNHKYHIRPSHRQTHPVGLQSTREDHQHHDMIINNTNPILHQASLIQTQSLGIKLVDQQSLREVNRPHTSIGRFNSYMPTTAVKPLGPNLDPVSQPRVLETESLIDQRQGTNPLARVSGRIEVAPCMQARVVPCTTDFNILRRDLLDRQIHSPRILQPDIVVKSPNIPIQSRNTSSRSPARDMTRIATASISPHIKHLPDSKSYCGVYPPRPGNQNACRPVNYHHLSSQSTASHMGNLWTRPIECNTSSHYNPPEGISEINPQGRSSELDPITIGFFKSHPVEPSSNFGEPKRDPTQPTMKTLQPGSEHLQPRKSSIQPAHLPSVKADSIQSELAQLDSADPDPIQVCPIQPGLGSSEESKKAVALGTRVSTAISLNEMLPPSSSANKNRESLHQLTENEGRQACSFPDRNSYERSNVNGTDLDPDQAHVNKTIVEGDLKKHENSIKISAYLTKQVGLKTARPLDVSIETHFESESSNDTPKLLQDDDKRTTGEELASDQEIWSSLDHNKDIRAGERYQLSIDKLDYSLLDPGSLDVVELENGHTNDQARGETSHQPSIDKIDEQSERDNRDLRFRFGDRLEENFQYSDMEATDSDEAKKLDRDELDNYHDDTRDDNDGNEQFDKSGTYQVYDLVNDQENHCDDDHDADNLYSEIRDDRDNIDDRGNDHDDDHGNDHIEDFRSLYNKDYEDNYSAGHGNVYNEDYWDDYSEDRGNEYYQSPGNDYDGDRGDDYDVKANVAKTT